MRSALVLFFVLLLPSALLAQDEPTPSPVLSLLNQDSLAVDLVLGWSLDSGPKSGAWPGVRLEFDQLPGPWGWELSYAYRSKEYFSYNHQSNQWSGPWPWEQTDSQGISESQWPFYQTRHVIAPGVLFRPKKGWVQPKLGLGLLLQFYASSEADQFYPAYLASFQDYVKGVRTLWGNYLKFGLDTQPWPFVEFGLDLVFEIPDWGRFYSAIQERPAQYVKSNAHPELRLGVRL